MGEYATRAEMRSGDIANGIVIVGRMGGSRNTERKLCENLGRRRRVESGLLMGKPREMTLKPV